MQPSTTDKTQISFLLPDLERQLDPRNALFRLARAMDWSVFEKEFRPLYCTEGRPALPIRRLVGLLMLKSLRNLSDEEVVILPRKPVRGFVKESSENGRNAKQVCAAV